MNVKLILENAFGEQNGFIFPIRTGYFEVMILAFQEILHFDRSREEIVCNCNGAYVRVDDPGSMETILKQIVDVAGADSEFAFNIQTISGM